jgi:hypothetical protein
VFIRNARRAFFGVKAIRERFAKRVDAAARTRSGLENRDVVTEFGEFVSGNKPGHSGAQYEHLFGRARKNCYAGCLDQPDTSGCESAAPQKLTASYCQVY